MVRKPGGPGIDRPWFAGLWCWSEKVLEKGRLGRLRVPKGDAQVEAGTSEGPVTSQSVTVASVNTWLRRATVMVMMVVVVRMVMMMSVMATL